MKRGVINFGMLLKFLIGIILFAIMIMILKYGVFDKL